MIEKMETKMDIDQEPKNLLGRIYSALNTSKNNTIVFRKSELDKDPTKWSIIDQLKKTGIIHETLSLQHEDKDVSRLIACQDMLKSNCRDLTCDQPIIRSDPEKMFGFHDILVESPKEEINRIQEEIDRLQRENRKVFFSINKEKFLKYYEQTTKLPDEKIFWFDDNKTFKLKVIGAEPKVINFSPTGTRGTDCYCLMKALIELLRREGIKDGKWAKANFTRDDIIKMVQKLFQKTVTTNWVDDTKGNWKKIIPEDWVGYIEFSDFNRSSKGYEFKLKMPS